MLANNHIRVQDQLAFPQAGDIQALMHELSKLVAACFFLIYDFSSAHRLVPVRYEDWGFQACRLEGDVDAEGNEMVWGNKVGMFGVASAAYWWARLGGAIVRSSHHLLGPRLGVWHTLFADDGLVGKDFPIRAAVHPLAHALLHRP